MVRNEKGQFVKGNGGGPGRPPKSREEKYYHVAMNTVTFARWKKIIDKAAQQAERGDASARKWLSEYLAPQTQRHAIGNLLDEVFEIEMKDTDGD